MTADEARQAIAREIAADERLLWSGVPKQGLALRGSDAFLIPFSLMWGGFALVWETTVLATGAPLLFKLWGIPFVLMGLYLIAGRFFVDAWQRRRTAYGITDQRAIILSGLTSRNVKSLPLRTLTDMTLSEANDGSGTISFGPSPPWGRAFGAANWPGSGERVVPAFEFIPDAKRVFARLREAQSEA